MKTVYHNGVIVTGNRQQDISTAPTCLVVENDLVVYVGNDDNLFIVKTMENTKTKKVNLEGRIILPGFIDGHMHLLFFGASLSKIDLESCKNLTDIRTTIKSAAQQNPSAKRLFCRGWMHPMTNGIALASMIDDLDPQRRPIFIDSKDLHSTWCNTAALKELGVDENTPDPEGGEISRDPETGKPNGLLSEAANVNIAWPHVARVATVDERVGYIRDAVEAYNAAGYTGITEMATDHTIWEAMRVLREQEDVPIRMAAYWIITPCKTDEENLAQVDRAIDLHRQYNSSTSPDFRIVGIKLICDGVVDACTASLLEPYSTNGANAETVWASDALRKVVEKADAAGLQCALHAIGDATVKLAIDTLEAVGTPGRRHRIEHLELTAPEDAKRLGDVGITASVQPVHADPAILRAWSALLGPTRLQRAFAYKEFLDHHAPLAIGTDSPTAPHWPLKNVYTATTRRSAREPEYETKVNEHFALGLGEAVSAGTAGSAYSTFADGFIGTLGEGKKADFVVWDMQWEKEKLLEAVVYETYFGGRQVYHRS
ncbi:amidohydrolase [Aspergillus chevalieri]|uniref:Amidohydrolase 3 domain-containing protein n=1 Tax=Aspergillus chevalieri TaxID=182096 RepID=A0A7R7VP78_ASPCH|nr:uncharacterized protein ACHE_40763S [Aspergillus chevalieri]BCR88199.1 hypothetical protein ACHE_40763S [Aspergillus chevalieri]